MYVIGVPSPLSMTADLEGYRDRFNALTTDRSGSVIIILTTGITDYTVNPVINHLSADSEVDQDTIHTAYKYVNGDSNFVTLNRFINTIQLIKLIQSGLKSLDSVK